MSTADVPIRPSVTVPRCPIGNEDLRLGSQGALDFWSCPAGHGLAMTLSESHQRVQDDEVGDLWQLARAAQPGPITSPFGRRQMVRISLPYDADEAPTGDDENAPTIGTVDLDVDLEEQFIWFDAGEVDQLPFDLADAGPTATEVAALEQIRAKFGSDLDAALEARDDHELTEKIYQRIARNPGLLKTLDSVGRTVTTY